MRRSSVRGVTRTVRSRGAPQRSARVAPRQSTEQPPAVRYRDDDGNDPHDRNPGAGLCRRTGRAGRNAGLLGNVSVMNAPFSVQNYTSKLIEDQQARTAGDVLQNDASVRTTNNGNGGYDDTFQIRGFQVDGADVGLQWNVWPGVALPRAGLHRRASSAAEAPPRCSTASRRTIRSAVPSTSSPSARRKTRCCA